MKKLFLPFLSMFFFSGELPASETPHHSPPRASARARAAQKARGQEGISTGQRKKRGGVARVKAALEATWDADYTGNLLPLIKSGKLEQFFDALCSREEYTTAWVIDKLYEDYEVPRPAGRSKLVAPTVLSWLLCADDAGGFPQKAFAKTFELMADEPSAGQRLILESMPFVFSFKHELLGEEGRATRAGNLFAMLHHLLVRREKDLIQELFFVPQRWPRPGNFRNEEGYQEYEGEAAMGLRYFISHWFDSSYITHEKMASLFDALCAAVDPADVRLFFEHKSADDVHSVFFDLVFTESPSLLKVALNRAFFVGGKDLLEDILRSRLYGRNLLQYVLDERCVSVTESAALASPIVEALEKHELFAIAALSDTKGRNLGDIVDDYVKKNPESSSQVVLSPECRRYLSGMHGTPITPVPFPRLEDEMSIPFTPEPFDAPCALEDLPIDVTSARVVRQPSVLGILNPAKRIEFFPDAVEPAVQLPVCTELVAKKGSGIFADQPGEKDIIYGVEAAWLQQIMAAFLPSGGQASNALITLPSGNAYVELTKQQYDCVVALYNSLQGQARQHYAEHRTVRRRRADTPPASGILPVALGSDRGYQAELGVLRSSLARRARSKIFRPLSLPPTRVATFPASRLCDLPQPTCDAQAGKQAAIEGGEDHRSAKRARGAHRGAQKKRPRTTYKRSGGRQPSTFKKRPVGFLPIAPPEDIVVNRVTVTTLPNDVALMAVQPLGNVGGSEMKKSDAAVTCAQDNASEHSLTDQSSDSGDEQIVTDGVPTFVLEDSKNGVGKNNNENIASHKGRSVVAGIVSLCVAGGLARRLLNPQQRRAFRGFAAALRSHGSLSHAQVKAALSMAGVAIATGCGLACLYHGLRQD